MVSGTITRRLPVVHRFVVGIALTLALAAPLAGCKIVPISEDGAQEEAGFDAAGYASAIWSERGFAHFGDTAQPVTEVLPAISADLSVAGPQYGSRAGEGSPWSFVVTGTGTVVEKNTESRAGTMVVELDDATGSLQAMLQIGPVIRGNAVRDALPFVSFKDFINQLEFADAGKALTALALEGVSGSIEELKVGDQIAFTGAMSIASTSDRMLITPVVLEKTGP
jgi:predicted lipoprotein